MVHAATVERLCDSWLDDIIVAVVSDPSSNSGSSVILATKRISGGGMIIGIGSLL